MKATERKTAKAAGYDAAIAGKPQYPHPAGLDELSYLSGWVEGDADLELARQIVRLPPAQRKIIDDLLSEPVKQ